MKILNRIVLGGALLCSMSALAVPAKRITYTVTQPDGTELTLTKAGDEFNKYYLTSDNQVVYKANGGYYFATVGADGAATTSDVLAADPGKRNALQRSFVESLNRESIGEAMTRTAERSKLATRKTSSSFKSPASRATSDVPQFGVGLCPGKNNFTSTGSPKVLIILVEYSDVKFKTTNAQSYFNSMLNQKGFSTNGADGSVLDWFTEASVGQFTPQFDVYGPVTLPNTRAYYGANDAYGDDLRPHYMVVDACNALDATVNFKDYDCNNDGMVDNVYVFYAGEGEADSYVDEAVWPHQWDLSSGRASITLDGVTIDHYGCSNEWDVNYRRAVGIGTFVHEFSHVMGLPDLYHTSSTVYYTPCEWSVLDYGPYNNQGRTPPTYSIYERNALGWADIEVLEKNDPKTVELQHIMTSNKGCLIPVPGKTTEFYLLENRQQTGWDAYIPGHGMLVWHIDYSPTQWTNNTVNNTKSHQYVDIVEANNNPSGNIASAISGWAFPGTNNVTSFTDTTTPNMLSWSGTKLETPITDITETNGKITFDVCGGKPDIQAPVAIQPSSSQIFPDYFIASWLPAEGAVDYLVTVKTEGEQSILTDTNTFGSGNTLTNAHGWTSSSTTYYTSAGNYGESAPSFKMSKATDWFATPAYDFPIIKVNFWAKGMSQSGNPLTVYAVDENGSETEIGSIANWNQTTGVVREFVVPNETSTQLKFKYSKPAAGNLAIDDVVVTYNATATSILDGYLDRSSEGGLTMLVNCPKAATYSYTVKAVNADGKISKASEKITVSLLSGIDSITAADENSPVEYFNLQGVRVENPAGGIFIRRQGSKVEKIIL